MKSARLLTVVMLAALLAGPTTAFLNSGSSPEEIYYEMFYKNTLLAESTEKFIKSSFPRAGELKRMSVKISLLAGRIEQNGIFAGAEMLLENFSPPDPEVVARNTEEIKKFVETVNIPSYIMLIPTSIAINQKHLPSAGVPLYNQKFFIEKSYDDFAGVLSSVEVYDTLFSRNDKYLYRRTDRGLTSLGGYFLYTALSDRLAVLQRDLGTFAVGNVSGEHYGELYERFPYASAPGDAVSFYRYVKHRREFKVTLLQNGEKRTYYTLFPLHTAELGGKTDALLGGAAERTDIHTASSYNNKLLVFGDETAYSYVPFLATDHNTVTLINVDLVTEETLRGISIYEYDKILFAYSLENFAHNSKVADISVLTAAVEKTDIKGRGA